jgi:hypothetical protein
MRSPVGPCTPTMRRPLASPAGPRRPAAGSARSRNACDAAEDRRVLGLQALQRFGIRGRDDAEPPGALRIRDRDRMQERSPGTRARSSIRRARA